MSVKICHIFRLTMKLLVGAVPHTSTTTPTEKNQEELLGRTVPPTSVVKAEVRKNKELLSGTVAPKTTVTLTAMKPKELFGGVVPPKSLATPTVRKQEELLAGAVPPPSTATQTGRKKMGLLWGTVPSVSTATLKTETRKSKSECSTVQTSQTWNQESEVAKVKLQGKANSQEVRFLHSEISRASGSLQKSTTKIQLPKQVSEMRFKK